MTRYVTRYVVTGVRLELAVDGLHAHLAGLYVGDAYFPRQHVVRSIAMQNEWGVRAGRRLVRIEVVPECANQGCHESPYLRATGPIGSHDYLNDLVEPRDQAYVA